MSETLRDEIRTAHAACREWERATFNLGSTVTHIAKLRSFVLDGGELAAALEAGRVRIEMPSEYEAPRFVIV